MQTSIEEYVKGIYKADGRDVNCEGITRIHEMDSENEQWLNGLEAEERQFWAELEGLQ